MMMQSSTASSASLSDATLASATSCIADLRQYIASFNAANLKGIRDCLDEDIQVYLDNKLVAQGRDTILPSYQADFDLGKQVNITKQPKVIASSDDHEVSVQVTLVATTQTDEPTTLDVIYTYNITTIKQVRHDIFLQEKRIGDQETLKQCSVGSKRAALKAWDSFLAYDKRYMKDLARLRQDQTSNRTTYANLAFGNPQDPPLPELVAALKRPIEKAEPPHGLAKSLEYKMSHPETIDAIVNSLLSTRSLQVDPHDILLTNGALAALSLSMFALGDPGDQVILLTPKYFFYQPMAEYAGLDAVLVPSNAEKGFDLDVEAIQSAITNKTRLIMLNSPNNPTGKIYPMASLQSLSSMLNEVNDKRRQIAVAENSHYHPIVVVSDEAYCRILFDENVHHSIAQVYPYTILVYTWAKTLLCPSERFGYICLSPLMPEPLRRELREKFFRAQLVGWSFPNGTTMQAYADIADIQIDTLRLQNRRNLLYDALKQNGWNAVKPQGGFYMLVQVPSDLFRDDEDLVEALLEQRVLALPGSIMDVDGWIRLSLTASDEMVDFAINAFRCVRAQRAGVKSQRKTA